MSTFSFQHFDSEATENSHEIKLTMRTGEAFCNPISYIYIYIYIYIKSVKRHPDNQEGVAHGKVEVN